MLHSERTLASAVLLLALDDLVAPEPRRENFASYSTFRGARRTWRAAKQEAEAFLTDTTGDWAQSREAWCEAADVDPAAIRIKALEAAQCGV